MKLISHRGNTNGKNPLLENKPDYIIYAINQGYDCEIDVWINNSKLFLGHDAPETEIKLDFLETYKDRLWIHCKNINALDYLIQKDFHCFFHDKDTYTITNKGYIWGNINSPLTNNTICVMPELHDKSSFEQSQLYNCEGICSDFIRNYDPSPKIYIGIIDYYFYYCDNQIQHYLKSIPSINIDFTIDRNKKYNVIFGNIDQLQMINLQNVDKLCLIGEKTDISGFHVSFHEIIDNMKFTHYTKNNLIEDVTFVIQGLEKQDILKYQHVLFVLFGKIVVSTWNKYNLQDIQSYIKQKNVCNAQNIYYQMYTTYKGLENTTTKWAVKVRSDEIYTYWSYFIYQMKKYPNKISCNNIFFRKESIKLHGSDHILGTQSDLLKKICEKCIRNLIGKSEFDCKNKELLWIAPETWVTTSHLELFYSYDDVYNNLDTSKLKDMMIQNYNIIDIDHFSSYLIVFHHWTTKFIITPFNKKKILQMRSIIELKDISEVI